MQRSTINYLIKAAERCFLAQGWALPPRPRWDVTDFGLGNWREYGLVLVNLAEETEYCEKLMYAQRNMKTPAHCHRRKKEDIICRWGRLAVRVWSGRPGELDGNWFSFPIDHELTPVRSGDVVEVQAGSRVTLFPGVYHEFYPLSEECILGEVSSANDDLTDNVFDDVNVGRFPGIEEDEAAIVRLVSEG